MSPRTSQNNMGSRSNPFDCVQKNIRRCIGGTSPSRTMTPQTDSTIVAVSDRRVRSCLGVIGVQSCSSRIPRHLHYANCAALTVYNRSVNDRRHPRSRAERELPCSQERSWMTFRGSPWTRSRTRSRNELVQPTNNRRSVPRSTIPLTIEILFMKSPGRGERTSRSSRPSRRLCFSLFSGWLRVSPASYPEAVSRLRTRTVGRSLCERTE